MFFRSDIKRSLTLTCFAICCALCDVCLNEKCMPSLSGSIKCFTLQIITFTVYYAFISYTFIYLSYYKMFYADIWRTVQNKRCFPNIFNSVNISLLLSLSLWRIVFASWGTCLTTCTRRFQGLRSSRTPRLFRAPALLALRGRRKMMQAASEERRPKVIIEFFFISSVLYTSKTILSTFCIIDPWSSTAGLFHRQQVFGGLYGPNIYTTS